MNLKTSMKLLLKTITFIACISLSSTFAHKLRGSIIVEVCGSDIVEPVQSFDKHRAFPVPGE